MAAKQSPNPIHDRRPRSDASAPARSGTKDSDEFLRRYVELQPRSFWYVARNRLIRWAALSHARAPQRILEIGCGTGFVLAELRATFRRAQLVGTDLRRAALEYAALRTPNAEFRVAHAAQPIGGDNFDLIGCFDVLEHIDDDVEVLTTMFDGLRPGGVAILTVPQHGWLWSANDEASGHVRRYEAVQLHRRVTAVGFEILRSTSFVSIPLPAMFIANLRRGSSASQPDQVLEKLVPHPRVDRLLRAAMAIEYRWITAGRNFPVGGSRLVIARRAQ